MTTPEATAKQEMWNAFEKWSLEHKCEQAALDDLKKQDHHSGTLSGMWAAWQAAWSARTLPVEAIKESINLLARDSEAFHIFAAQVEANTKHIAALTQLLEPSHER